MPVHANSVAGPADLSRQASRLLARLVNSCDLLHMEARESERGELADLIARIGRLALETSRQTASLAAPEPEWARFRAAIAGILALLDDAQRVSAEAGNVLRGEDLLSLQVTALELRALADPSAERHSRVRAADPAGPSPSTARLLVVDDDEGNREILARLLRTGSWELQLAGSGKEALARLRAEEFDLMMLDVLMPGMDGLALLRKLREDERLRDVPVIMISGVDQTANVAACLGMGARDYVFKPFNPILLRARLNSALENRRMAMRERERLDKLQETLADLKSARAEQERLIESLLPGRAAEELKNNGSVDPRYYNDVTVVFTDFVGFTASCSKLTAYELVGTLNEYFTAFDRIVAKYGLERLKTVGDAYICVGGLSIQKPSHPNDAVLAAIEMLEVAAGREGPGPRWPMRIGINTGPVVSGVVGIQRLAFDIWGDTVNLAARIVAAGEPAMINVSEKTFQRVKELFRCESRGDLPVKGDRRMEMFFVKQPSESLDGMVPEERERRFRDRYRSYFGYGPAALPRSLFADRALDAARAE